MGHRREEGVCSRRTIKKEKTTDNLATGADKPNKMENSADIALHYNWHDDNIGAWRPSRTLTIGQH